MPLKCTRSVTLRFACRIAKSFVLLFVILAASASRPVAQEAVSVAGLDNTCVSSDSDTDGVLFIINHCTFAVETLWFYGSGNQGYASLAAGERASTGKRGIDIPHIGVLRYFACPVTHPFISDRSGQFLTGPVEEYHCAPDNARSSESTAPRPFTYDVLTSGDCVLEKGLLTFDASGEGHWQAKIHTNHTTNRDIWHVSFNVLESTGRPLFPVFLGDSPSMYGSPSPVIPWSILFKFDRAKFRLIDHVTISTSC